MTEGSPMSNNHSKSTNDKDNSSILIEKSSASCNLIDEEKKFKFALKFFRDFDGKAFTPSYDNRNKLVALSLQVKYGKFVPEKAPGQGALDLVGRDRAIMWQTLGDVSRNDAMKQFVDLLSNLCPLFQPYIQAHMSSELHKKDDSCGKSEDSIQIHSNGEVAPESAHQQEQEDPQKKQIQSILNEQTYEQFRSYAEMQYPGQVEKQSSLIKQLQEQHYQQYMQQVMQQQFQMEQSLKSVETSSPAVDNPTQPVEKETRGAEDVKVAAQVDQTEAPQEVASKSTSNLAKEQEEQVKVNGSNRTDTDTSVNGTDEVEKSSTAKSDGVKCDSSNDGGESDELVLATAQMWTRQDIESFRESIRKDGNEGQIKIGHGEVVTIQVPTHPEGSSIFWEFCTDSYDIAFGLLFEWTDDPGTQVSVHVSDDSDDSEEDDLTQTANGVESALNLSERDAELAFNSSNSDGQALPQTEVLIPICRRDSHREIYTGSHVYPGRGKYLLKFDNSYSMLRSKNLYYRVYYTR